MNRHDYAVLTLRGFALYAWFQALSYFLSGMMEIWLAYSHVFDSRMPALLFAISIFVAPAAFFALGLFLFVRSRALASWLMPRPEETPAGELPPHPLPAACVAFAAVGAGVFLFAVPGVLNPLIAILRADNDARLPSPSLTTSEEIRIVTSGAQLILGFFLFLKARVFATAWWRKQQRNPAVSISHFPFPAALPVITNGLSSTGRYSPPSPPCAVTSIR